MLGFFVSSYCCFISFQQVVRVLRVGSCEVEHMCMVF